LDQEQVAKAHGEIDGTPEELFKILVEVEQKLDPDTAVWKVLQGVSGLKAYRRSLLLILMSMQSTPLISI
jgi:hypothetical protein